MYKYFWPTSVICVEEVVKKWRGELLLRGGSGEEQLHVGVPLQGRVQLVVKIQVFCVNQAASGYRRPAKRTSFQHVVKVQVLCVNQAASGYRRPAKRTSFQLVVKVQVLCVSQAASGHRRSAKKRSVLALSACWGSASCQPGCIRISVTCKNFKRPSKHLQKVKVWWQKVGAYLFL